MHLELKNDKTIELVDCPELPKNTYLEFKFWDTGLAIKAAEDGVAVQNSIIRDAALFEKLKDHGFENLHTFISTSAGYFTDYPF